MKVGPKGQVVIPKEIRNITGIKENTEVIVSLNDDCIVIKKSKPATESYLTYYTATYSKKLKNNIDINKILDEEYDRDFLHWFKYIYISSHLWKWEGNYIRQNFNIFEQELLFWNSRSKITFRMPVWLNRIGGEWICFDQY